VGEHRLASGISAACVELDVRDAAAAVLRLLGHPDLQVRDTDKES
jgi:hypothetical protein